MMLGEGGEVLKNKMGIVEGARGYIKILSKNNVVQYMCFYWPLSWSLFHDFCRFWF
jgi:hypothetical protein